MSFGVTYKNPKKFSLEQYASKVFALIFHNKVFEVTQVQSRGWWYFYSGQMSFLWIGFIYNDYLVSAQVDRRRAGIIGKDFASDFIPEASTATYRLQADADFINDDSADNLWFDGVGNQNDVTNIQLYSQDYNQTVVMCGHQSPYDVSRIGLLRSGTVMNQAQLDRIHEDFELWVFWSGVLNEFGFIKDNRTIP